MMGENILLVAGELSGDLHAANLVAELHRLRPGLRFFGVAGPRMRQEDVEAIAQSEELSHMGLVEVIRELPRLRAIMKSLLRSAEKRRPSLAILVDSPDFNLRLAVGLKKLGIPVLLYISPQLWAWRKGRVRKVRRLAQEVLCILPFEVDFYRQHRVEARYVGHPLLDEVGELTPRVRTGQGRDLRLALLPGSRAMEVRSLFPAMLDALDGLPAAVVGQVQVIVAPGMGRELHEILSVKGRDSRLEMIEGPIRREALRACDLAWTASGTATLECALLSVPMIVGYRLQSFSWVLARLLVHVPHVALVNLIAGKALVPELLQKEWDGDGLVEATLGLISGGFQSQIEGLAEVRQRLGPPGASRHAAEAVLAHISHQ